MEQFRGFPAKTQFTPLPKIFFSTLLPQISDIAELKVTIYILATLYLKKGYPRFISRHELEASPSLRKSLKQLPTEALAEALEMATRRGSILHLKLEKEGGSEDIYLLNDEQSRQALTKIEAGELKLAGLKTGAAPSPQPDEQTDIFTLYEQNIGMLTPMIAEELKEAEQTYPVNWIRDAVKEAVNHNKRKWSYISAILERWTAEGRESGTYRRDSKKEDPNKYIKGKYGHMVQR